MAESTRLPPLNGLRVFEAAGRHLNFRAAADELGVTQGAVAQQVRGLEAHLSLRLFERRAKGLAFTGVGRSYHGQVSAALALLQEATEALKPEPSKVTISVTPTFAAKWLLPNLPILTARHPEIDLRVLATESVLSFHADGIDLAIRQGQSPFGASLDARLLFRQEIVAVAAPALIAKESLPLASDALNRLALLHDTHNLWPAFYRHVFGVRDLAASKGLSFSQTSLSIDAALAEQGIALASRFLVDRDLRSGRLLQVVPGTLRGDRDFYLLALKTDRRQRAVDDVINWLETQSHSNS